LESLQQPSKFSPEIRNNVLFYFWRNRGKPLYAWDFSIFTET
jgi:hypothetical protein